jgi:hypothetical protein
MGSGVPLGVPDAFAKLEAKAPTRLRRLSPLKWRCSPAQKPGLLPEGVTNANHREANADDTLNGGQTLGIWVTFCWTHIQRSS